MFPELTVRDCPHRQSRRHVFWIVYAASSHPRLTGAYLRPSVAGLYQQCFRELPVPDIVYYYYLY
jgi:hypothetical protein